MGGVFLNVNRNKRSVVLDLKQDGGKDVLRRLIPTADVFFHNMRPKVIGRPGFDYEAVSALKPDIVYCGAYGYSENGPYAAKPAYDDLIQGASGLAVLGADEHAAPRYTPIILVDKLVGLVARQAFLSALFHRPQTGDGQAIEVPMFETMAAFMLAEHIYGRAFVPPIGGTGYAPSRPRIESPPRPGTDISASCPTLEGSGFRSSRFPADRSCWKMCDSRTTPCATRTSMRCTR